MAYQMTRSPHAPQVLLDHRNGVSPLSVESLKAASYFLARAFADEGLPAELDLFRPMLWDRLLLWCGGKKTHGQERLIYANYRERACYAAFASPPAIIPDGTK